MSQSSGASSASAGRMALAVGIIALVLGASALGYAVYLGQSQLPSQISAVSVNVKPSDKTIRIDWTLDDTGQDRFNPQYVTASQASQTLRQPSPSRALSTAPTEQTARAP